jgi:hypothetical protein
MLKIERINHCVIHGDKVTLFSLYEYDQANSVWLYQGEHSIKGHYKRHSTILKKYQERLNK